MDTKLNPVILAKLLAFRDRWRMMVLIRGVGGTLAIFGGVLILLALADWLIIMPDHIRWSLSGAMYLAAVIVLIFFCIRPLVRLPGHHEIARRLEAAEPSLREDLLSAVELADTDAGHQWDSPAFRKLLQQDVARRVERVHLPTVLPARRVRGWLFAVLAVSLLAGGLASFGSGRQLMLRALAPMANIDRVSRNKIIIVQPGPQERPAVPEGDSLAVVIRVTGPVLKALPVMELFLPDGKEQKVPFRPAKGSKGESLHASSVAVDTQPVQYRIRAGDAITRKFTALPVPRPHAKLFTKEYRPPAYSGQAVRTEQSKKGALKGLVDTKVNLKIQIDQALKAADLFEVVGNQTNALKLVQANSEDPNEWSQLITLREDGSYTLFLHAKDTGLTNKFIIRHEIIALPDLKPTLILKEPKGQATAKPEDVLAFKAFARDDVGLKSAEHLVKVGTNVWTTNALALPAGTTTNATLAFSWDLLKIDVKPNDHVLTKLAVTDLKGTRVESRPVKLEISSDLFDTKRIAVLKARRQLRQSLTNLATAARDVRNALPATFAQITRDGKDIERREIALKGAASLDGLTSRLTAATQAVDPVMRGSRAGREAASQSLVLRLLGQVEFGHAAALKRHLATLSGTGTGPLMNSHASQVERHVTLINSLCQEMAQTLDRALASDEAVVIVDHLDYLARGQRLMNRLAEQDAASDPKAYERLARRQKGAVAELTVVADVLEALIPRLPAAEATLFKTTLADVKIHREALKQALAAAPGKALLGPARKLEAAVSAQAGALRKPVFTRFAKAAAGRLALARMAAPSADLIFTVRDRLRNHQNARGKLADAKEAKKGEAQAAADAELAEALSTHAWAMAADRLRRRARAEELRPDSDAAFVSDLTRAAQAVDQLRDNHQQGIPAEEVIAVLARVAGAVRKLEAGYGFAEMTAGLQHLAKQERWEKVATDANSLRPGDWAWLLGRLNGTSADLKAAQIAGPAPGLLRDAAKGNATRAVTREMESRKKRPGIFRIEKTVKKP